jgi:hypothetical protein
MTTEMTTAMPPAFLQQQPIPMLIGGHLDQRHQESA